MYTDIDFYNLVMTIVDSSQGLYFEPSEPQYELMPQLDYGSL